MEPIPEPEGETEIIETAHDIGQDNFSGSVTLELDIHKVVSSVSAIGIMVFTFLTLVFQNDVEPLFVGLRECLATRLAWFFLLSGNVFVLVCLGLIVSPLGRIRLGGPEATPDLGYVGWFSMLFAAGMGIGMMFFGVSEPLSHYTTAFEGITLGHHAGRGWQPHRLGTARRRRGQRGGRAQSGHGRDDLPLGPAPLPILSPTAWAQPCAAPEGAGDKPAFSERKAPATSA